MACVTADFAAMVFAPKRTGDMPGHCDPEMASIMGNGFHLMANSITFALDHNLSYTDDAKIAPADVRTDRFLFSTDQFQVQT